MLITVKIGTKIVLNEDVLFDIVSEICELISSGEKFIIVSSGAVGLGKKKLNFGYHATLSEKQALSSVGQIELMKLYQKLFSKFGIEVAQILVTYNDINSRKSFLHLRNTINEILKMGVVPIINENDAVAVDEIKFGNNDILSALVSTAVATDKLIILTDVDGVYKNFGTPNQEIINVVSNVKEVYKFMKGKKFDLSTGGMKTKVQAGFICMKSNIECIVANGFRKNILKDVLYKGVGTRFVPESKIRSFKDRMLMVSKKKGYIIIDKGACQAIKDKKSLLPIGIVDVKGKFSVGDVVFVSDEDGNNVAIGITNYSSSEISKIKGKKSYQIGEILGIKDFDEEVIHVDNMILI
ncbi:MAG: glutamate 5-kinase [Brevinematia bacterium]